MSTERTIDLAVIPVAGLGTRLLPATKSQPKEMLPVGRKPVVQYIVEELAAAGIRRIVFITGPGKTSIENHFDINADLINYLRETGREESLEELEFERCSVEFGYIRQRRQLGLGHAILCALPFVGQQPFVVALGDSLLGSLGRSAMVRTMIEEFQRSQADLVVAFDEVPREEVVHYGIAKPKGGGPPGERCELADLVEKPSVAEAPSRLAVAARYVFSPRIFEALGRTKAGKGGEIQLTDAMRLVLAEGGRGIGLKLLAGEQRHDIGNFESYFQAFIQFALDDAKLGPGMREYLRKLVGP